MAELDPTLLLRDLTRTMHATRAWLALRRTSPSDAADRDPFAAARWVSSQSTLAGLREKKGDPAAPYLVGWVARLLFLRVNGEAELSACAAREPAIVRVSLPSPAELSIRAVILRMVREPHADVRWDHGRSLVRASGEAQARERAAWARRGEIAQKLGLAHADELTSPLERPGELAAIAVEALDASHELARHAVGRSARFTDSLALAGGSEPPLPWPGRLSMRAIVDLFRGEAGWLDVPDLTLGDAPSMLVPASIARGFARFGARWADASAARSLPLPLAHAPSELPRRTIGALIAALLRSPAFLVRTMGFSRSEAERAARAMARVQLVAWRVAAARLLLREPALAGDAKGVREAADVHVARALLTPFPVELALVMPRLTETDPARLLAFGEAARLATFLRDRCDDDWFRNPRAVVELRDRLGRAPALHVSADDARAGVALVASTLGAELA